MNNSGKSIILDPENPEGCREISPLHSFVLSWCWTFDRTPLLTQFKNVLLERQTHKMWVLYILYDDQLLKYVINKKKFQNKQKLFSCTAVVTLWGGHLAPHAAAQEDAWRKMLAFMQNNLRRWICFVPLTFETETIMIFCINNLGYFWHEFQPPYNYSYLYFTEINQ